MIVDSEDGARGKDEIEPYVFLPRKSGVLVYPDSYLECVEKRTLAVDAQKKKREMNNCSN